MNVGIARITLRVPHSRGLKDKRRVVNSLRRRALNKFDVAIAEVDLNDTWQTASLGIACVSDGAAQTRRVLDSVTRFIESERPDAEVIDCETEIISGF